MSDSIWNDPRITAYVLNELPDDERVSFEQEMKTSPELAAAVHEARSLTGHLEGWYAAEASARLDDQRRESIVASESGGDAAPSASAVTPQSVSEQAIGPRLTAQGMLLATAASIMLVLGAASWVANQRAQNAADHLQMSSLDAKSKPEPQAAAMPDSDREASTPEMAESWRSPESNADDIVAVESEPLFGDVSSDALAAGSGVGLKPARKSSRRSGPTPAEGSLPPSAVEFDVDMIEEEESLTEAVTAIQPAPARPNATNQTVLPPTLAQSIAGRAAQSRRAFEAERAANTTSLAVLPTPPSRSAMTPRGRYIPGQVEADEFSDSLSPAYSNRDQRAQGALPVDSFGLERHQPVAPAAPRQAVTELAINSATRRDGLNVFGGGGSEQRLDDELRPDRRGFGMGVSVGGRYEPIVENEFRSVAEEALSTFSIDVDTASYSKMRNYLTTFRQLPNPNSVRIEELVNYFHYDYPSPKATSKHPFAAHAMVTSCPWNEDHRLARIALKGKVIEPDERPRCNLVFLLDTSGSMDQPNKLPLVIDGMKMLLKQLEDDDRVAITVYAGSAGLVLDSTPVEKSKKIRRALNRLSAGGSTNGASGIQLAYRTARDHFIADGVNRVILCTDGDFNVGTTGTEDLARMVEREAKGGIYLSVLGFGMDNHNDAMLEQISGRGNGNYAFIDTQSEAQKVLVEQTNSTLVTIAKDVKLQIEFNPRLVSAYRLIGYENRRLAKEDFNDDAKDAGEIGAGHEVTALYEIVPAGTTSASGRPVVDELKYQRARTQPTEAAESDEMMTLKLRYKQPDSETSTLVEFAVKDEGTQFGNAGNDVRFAAAVAGFGMQLRQSRHRGTWSLSDVIRTADASIGDDPHGLRSEFVDLIRTARPLLEQR